MRRLLSIALGMLMAVSIASAETEEAPRAYIGMVFGIVFEEHEIYRTDGSRLETEEDETRLVYMEDHEMETAYWLVIPEDGPPREAYWEKAVWYDVPEDAEAGAIVVPDLLGIAGDAVYGEVEAIGDDFVVLYPYEGAYPAANAEASRFVIRESSRLLGGKYAVGQTCWVLHTDEGVVLLMFKAVG